MSALTNEQLIEKYKDTDKIIADYYKLRDKQGKLINLTGTIVPLRIDNR